VNTKLEQLFDLHTLSLRDRHEIRQIFLFVSSEKKQHILDRFSDIVTGMRQLVADMVREQEILLGKTIESIESKVVQLRKQHIASFTENSLSHFKKAI
jgi:hypothetical protein